MNRTETNISFASRAPSTRIIAAIWWFFTLIMVSSYTANLAAFLTVEQLSPTIKSVEDLKECGLPDKVCPVTFGAKKGGSTLNFFKDAEHPTYKSMYAYMSAHPEYLTEDNAQGLEWAKTRNYAFLMESSSIEYIIERNCNVTQIGSPLDEKGYGIAMRKSYGKSIISNGHSFQLSLFLLNRFHLSKCAQRRNITSTRVG